MGDVGHAERGTARRGPRSRIDGAPRFAEPPSGRTREDRKHHERTLAPPTVRPLFDVHRIEEPRAS